MVVTEWGLPALQCSMSVTIISCRSSSSQQSPIVILHSIQVSVVPVDKFEAMMVVKWVVMKGYVLILVRTNKVGALIPVSQVIRLLNVPQTLLTMIAPIQFFPPSDLGVPASEIPPSRQKLGWTLQAKYLSDY
ncbi:hypothetical protein [Cellulophaga sp. BC115SP]|uniref:hypothetical protein n=1 Tax=Cellulophaga sp. BC115SP TaxID=2683263 RepID=UPI0014131CE7|nr:hypothetical protein [Cellulophaga sp. BC115SP]NBB31761.1 hypothetical protein [Cellulophaga sp. BC115SP]